MTRPNELRIFISSTFRDMQEEREHLIRKVFPEIRTLCRQRGITFTEIDLRWGLTEEEAVLGRVIRTCLEEIDRCRPHFIGMVGDRYGWVPEYHEIAMDPELGLRYPWIEQLALEGRSVTEIEFVHGVFDHPEIDDNAVHFYRRSTSQPQPNDATPIAQLVDRIEQSEHSLERYDDIEELGERVRNDLLATINRIWPEEESPSEFAQETRAHAAFAQSRRRAYIPNPQHLRQFTAWSKSDAPPMVLAGASGLGKSALGAFLADMFRQTHTNAFVIEHYVGASESSGKGSDVMRHVIRAICNEFDLEDDVPETPEALLQAFPAWLFRLEHLSSTQERPALILVDALDRLDLSGQHLNWLPGQLPASIRVICTTTPGLPLDGLRNRAIEELEVKPLEDERLRQSIIIRYLGEFHKGIAPARLARIASDEKSQSPLFLRIVAEELRLHGNHETLDEEIDRLLAPQDIVGTFASLLTRLEIDFGQEAVRTVCSLIALSMTGLSESEILGSSGVSRLDLSQLLPALDFHLVRSEGLFLYHDRDLLTAVKRRYIQDDAENRRLRRAIVDHLAAQPIDRRTLLELLPQLVEIDDREQIEELLCRDEVYFFVASNSLEYEIFPAWQQCGGLDKMLLPYQEIASREIESLASTLESRIAEAPATAELLEDPEIAARLKRAPTFALTFVRTGHPHVVLEICRSMYDRFSRLLPDRHPLIRQIRYQIARGYWQKGDYEAAEQVIEQMLRSAEESQETSPEKLIDILTIQGVVLAAQSRFVEAEQVNRRIIAMPSTPHTDNQRMNAMTNLAFIHRNNDRLDEAMTLLDQVLRYRRTRFGSEHPETAEVLNNVVNIQYEKGEIDEALHHLHEVIAIRQRTLGSEHPATVRALGNLGIIRQQQGRFEEARTILCQVLPTIERMYGKSHPVLANMLTPLAGVYVSLNRAEEALTIIDRSIEIINESLAKSAPIWTDAQEERARALKSLGRRAEAIETLEKLHQQIIVNLGEDHSRVKQIQELIAEYQN